MLMKKTVSPKKLKRAFLEKSRNHNGEYSYGRMVLCMGELKSKGYFFTGEWAGEKEQCMEFTHFLTSAQKYLHLRYTSAEEQRGKRLLLSLDDSPGMQGQTEALSGAKSQEPICSQITGEAYPLLPFAQIMDRLGLCLKERELTPVDDIALREHDTDSLLTVLAKNRLVQKRVGRYHRTAGNTTVAVWVGEFLDEKAGPGEASYVYLAQCSTVETLSKGPILARRRGYQQVDWYVMKSKTPVALIRPEEDVEVWLEELKWLGHPFGRYYDLPETELSVHGEELDTCMPDREQLERILQQLKAEGYCFYRERVYLSMEERDVTWQESLTREQERDTMLELGIRTEYADCGIGQIHMEFIHSETLERKVINIDATEISLILDNFCVGYNGIYTPWFFTDYCTDPNYYGEEIDSAKLFFQREMVFPIPVFLDALQKYQLITEEDLELCGLRGNPETRAWFVVPCELPEYTPTAKEKKAISWKEAAEAEKARAIAEALQYNRVEILKREDGATVEIHANAEGTGAICLIDKNGMYQVKYVNGYMDVERALYLSSNSSKVAEC